MLVNPGDKRQANAQFQRYLDVRELLLYRGMQPVLAAAVRLAVRVGTVKAHDYVISRGGPVLLSAYKRVYHDQYRAVGEAVASAGAVTKAFGWDDDPPEDTDSWTGFYDEQKLRLSIRATMQIGDIAESLTRQVNNDILSRFSAGEDRDSIAKAVRDQAPAISKARAATIARTETHGSAMSALAAALAYKGQRGQRGVTVKFKEWLSAGDDRVRPAHKTMNGTRIRAEEVFQTDDGPMRFPGDDTLGASLSGLANCRCTILYSTDRNAV